ncbi:hypothetical protein [Streptomyces fuscichromogenes]|uniref:Uncharacterized protein n=1 Tax=Streptomyces fuscichromogenes TaxID=1324013 RepID=A0A918CUZ3_9ACTN|nr:hypothetical protein [Streptomyces fuscichromogenes]GGN32076.1 hypothetical protein GCM10011578_070490 [Streptomyces fuscichromogenes]
MALADGLGVLVAPADALGDLVAPGAADAVHEGRPVRSAFQGRPQLASFHHSFWFHELFVALFSALSDRRPPLSGQLVQAMAADGMPTVPTATAAMTIRRYCVFLRCLPMRNPLLSCGGVLRLVILRKPSQGAQRAAVLARLVGSAGLCHVRGARWSGLRGAEKSCRPVRIPVCAQNG